MGSGAGDSGGSNTGPRELGLTTRGKRSNRKGDARENNQNSIVQPKVSSQMDNSDVKSKLITADKTAPTNVEMTDDEYSLERKRRGRKSTVLTSVTGDTTKPTLAQKTLLGG